MTITDLTFAYCVSAKQPVSIGKYCGLIMIFFSPNYTAIIDNFITFAGKILSLTNRECN